MLEFIDPPAELPAQWEAWVEGSEHGAPQPVHLARPNLSDDGARWCGVFVTPAQQAMALRGWEDAFEGVRDGAPWVLFDVEKITRMMFHESGLAFEILGTAPAWSHPDFAARKIAESALTRGVIDYYRAVTAPLETTSTDLWRWRSLATALLLSRDATVAFDLQTAVGALDDERLEPLLRADRPTATVATMLRAELNADQLPERPTNYEWLNDYIPRARLQEWS